MMHVAFNHLIAQTCIFIFFIKLIGCIQIILLAHTTSSWDADEWLTGSTDCSYCLNMYFLKTWSGWLLTVAACFFTMN